MQLLKEKPVEPPGAPVRPYLSQPVPPAPIPAAPAAASQTDLQARIRSAVLARLGTQIDPQLLDVIIQRVIQQTGVK